MSISRELEQPAAGWLLYQKQAPIIILMKGLSSPWLDHVRGKLVCRPVHAITRPLRLECFKYVDKYVKCRLRGPSVLPYFKPILIGAIDFWPRQIRRLAVEPNTGFIDVNVIALLGKTTIESALSLCLYFEISSLLDLRPHPRHTLLLFIGFFDASDSKLIPNEKRPRRQF